MLKTSFLHQADLVSFSSAANGISTHDRTLYWVALFIVYSRPMAAYASNGPCPDGGDTVNLRQVSDCMVFENPLTSPTTSRAPGAQDEESGLVFFNETAMDVSALELQQLGMLPPNSPSSTEPASEDNQRLRVAPVQRSVSVKKIGPPKPARSPARSVRQCESLPQAIAVVQNAHQLQESNTPPALPARNMVKASVSVPQPSSHKTPRSPKKPPRQLLPLPAPSAGQAPSRPLPPPPPGEKPFLPAHLAAEQTRSFGRPCSLTALDNLPLSPENTVERTAITPQPRFSAPSLPQEFRIQPRSESNSPIPRRVVRRPRQRPRSSSMTALYTQPSKLFQDTPADTYVTVPTTDGLNKAMSCGQMSVDDDDEQVPTLPHRTSASYILMSGSYNTPGQTGKEPGADGVYQYDKLKEETAYESIKENMARQESPLYDSMKANTEEMEHDAQDSSASLGQTIQEEVAHTEKQVLDKNSTSHQQVMDSFPAKHGTGQNANKS